MTVVEDCYHDKEQWFYSNSTSIQVDGWKVYDKDPHTSKKKSSLHLYSNSCALVILFFIVDHNDVPVVQVLLFCASTKDR